LTPFDGLTLPKLNKNSPDRRQPFPAGDIAVLLNRALEKNDTELADIIRLAAFTGAREEEICRLRVEDIASSIFLVRGTKTAAAHRQIPIHSALKPTLARLIGRRKKGWLFDGLSEGQHGSRAHYIAHRFSKMKKEMGYPPAMVFHSIRKTVATVLENAGVPENVAAEIVGHDKPTMTYGLYSGGVDLAVKRRAIEKLKYQGYELQ